MHRFLIVVEEANGNYSAYPPGLPGCVATGETQEEAEGNMYQAIELHLKGLAEDNQSIPEPHASAEYVVTGKPLVMINNDDPMQSVDKELKP